MIFQSRTELPSLNLCDCISPNKVDERESLTKLGNKMKQLRGIPNKKPKLALLPFFFLISALRLAMYPSAAQRSPKKSYHQKNIDFAEGIALRLIRETKPCMFTGPWGHQPFRCPCGFCGAVVAWQDRRVDHKSPPKFNQSCGAIFVWLTSFLFAISEVDWPLIKTIWTKKSASCEP